MMTFAISVSSLGGRLTDTVADALRLQRPSHGGVWDLEVLPADWQAGGEDPDRLDAYLRLVGAGVTAEAAGDAPAARDPYFDGRTFVLTGTLGVMTRDEAAALIIARGGKVSSSVSKKTFAVIAGESAGSKLDKALALGVQVLDEQTFLALVSGATSMPDAATDA